MKKDLFLKKFSDKVKIVENMPHLSILILCNPCNGFGDIIFSFKLKKYLNQWYPFATVKIASTTINSFLTIGEDISSLIELKSISKELQCRRFANLSMNNVNEEEFNLIFVSPIQQDFDVSYVDIKKLIPYSNQFNTYFFSEYNDVSYKEIDFHTGIGKGKYGLMFTKIPSNILNDKIFLKNNNLKKGKYAVCYIANTIVNMRVCYQSFFEMICKKYTPQSATSKSKDKSFSIVIPPSLVEDIGESQSSLKKYYKYFSSIVLVKKDGEIVYEDLSPKNNNILYIRADILPVKNAEMLTLMHNSVNDILLTGDQSITDGLSCCPKKNIWYQIAPWKESFGRQLAIHMPQKYYKKKKTSCGTIEGIGLKSDFREFVKKYDFRKLARPKLNRIINMALEESKVYGV
jgi:hypothetical protein